MKTSLSRHVVRILLAIIAVASPVVARAALITYTVTITNTPLPGAGTNLTVNGITRNWTNAASLAGIQTNSAGVAASATNLFRSWAAFPQVGVTVYQTATNVVTFRGLDITLTQGGTWASVSSSSSATTSTTALQLPLSAAYVSQLWTNMDELSTNRRLHGIEFVAGLGLHGRALVATNYTLTTNDLYVGVDTRSNTNLILTLPSAATASNLLFVIKDEGGAGATNTIKIYPQSGDRIDMLLTNLVVSNNFGGVQLRSRGLTNWAVLAAGSGVTGGIGGGGGSSVPLTNSVWVAKNGNDSTGQRGDASKPYLTLGAAKTNAVSGDTIFVMPGTYDEKNLLKNGVNWHFFNGAKVTYTGAANGSIFDDGSDGANGAVTCIITGYGEFINNGSATYYVMDIENSSSNVRIQARSMSAYNAVYLDSRVTIEDCLIQGESSGGTNTPVLIFASTACHVTLDRCKVVATTTANNGAAIQYDNTSNTNSILRDCILIGNAAASSPVSIVGATSGAQVRIYGSLTSNLTNDTTNVSIIVGATRFEVDTDVNQ